MQRTISRGQIKLNKNLTGNWKLLRGAIEEFAPDFDRIKRGVEACDVIIRLYLLPETIKEAAKKLR